MTWRKWVLLSGLVIGLGTVASCSEDKGASAGDPGISSSEDATETPSETGQTESALTYYRDVAPILETMCVRCHSEGGIREQVPFTSYDEVAPYAALIKEMITNREMPPWLATTGCTEYAYDESLTETEIATVSEWVDRGVLEGSADVEPVTTEPRLFATLTRTDVTIEMPVDYVMKKSPDDYRCFLVDWPETEDTNITGFGAIPGNPAVVHHVIAYLVPPEGVATFEAYDEADEGPGYTCFGGPNGVGSDAGGTSGFGESFRFLGGWAPGGVGSDFPPGTGMPVEAGSKIALQVHYNTLVEEPQPDRTKVVFKVDKEVEHTAFVLPWTNYAWLGGTGMEIPAGEADVVHSHSADLMQILSFILGDNDVDRIRIYSAALHMHVLGTSGSVYIDRPDGTRECLLDIPNYDFGWQRTYGFMEPKEVVAGDRVGLECHWDNTQENQTWVGGEQLPPVDQHWGEGTNDEMCIAFFYIVPLSEEE